jgi:type IV secretory pathway VirJ component
MKNTFLSVIIILLSHTLLAQSTKLPLKEWTSNTQTPFVLYISGDGGINDFSTELCNNINKAGYTITAINSKSYFWDKKTPEQTAKDLSDYLQTKFLTRTNQQLILTGYSFGADVVPFIANKFPDNIRKKLLSVVLLSASLSTDFEIHFSDMIWGNKKRSMDVVSAINKMGTIKTAAIFDSNETRFPVKEIRLKNYHYEFLQGNHHFDNNIAEVAKTMMKYF